MLDHRLRGLTLHNIFVLLWCGNGLKGWRIVSDDDVCGLCRRVFVGRQRSIRSLKIIIWAEHYYIWYFSKCTVWLSLDDDASQRRQKVVEFGAAWFCILWYVYQIYLEMYTPFGEYTVCVCASVWVCACVWVCIHMWYVCSEFRLKAGKL